jgi:hypothetical protein
MINFSTDHLDNWRIKEIEEGGYWILPAHRSSRDQKSRKVVNTTNYWMVTVTLTSGDSKQFYIKAIDKFDAQEKAEQNAYRVEGLKEFALIQ